MEVNTANALHVDSLLHEWMKSKNRSFELNVGSVTLAVLLSYAWPARNAKT